MNMYVQALHLINSLATLQVAVARFEVVGSVLIAGCEPNDIDVLVLPEGADGQRPDQHALEDILFRDGWAKTAVYPGDFWCVMAKDNLNVLMCKDAEVFEVARRCQHHCEYEKITDKAERRAFWRSMMGEAPQ